MYYRHLLAIFIFTICDNDTDAHLKYNLGRPLICDVFFSFANSCYQLGCTIVAVSEEGPEENVKNTLQNITNEGTPQSVECLWHSVTLGLKFF